MPTINNPALTPAPDEVMVGAWAMGALAALGRISGTQDAAECLARFFDATRAMGASAGLYSVLIPEADGELSSITLFACDPGFAHGFEIGAAVMHPWLRYARQHTTAITGQQLPLQGPADEAAVALARQHGFGHCLLVPIAAGAKLGRTELLCLGADADAEPVFGANEARPLRALAHALAAELHGWFTLKLQASLLQEARLQPQDIQVLAWEWQGLSTKEIAHRTGMSIAAVDSRFQRLNFRLRCANRRAAARRAAEYGLLQSVPYSTAPAQRPSLKSGDAAAQGYPAGAVSPPPRRSASQPWR